MSGPGFLDKLKTKFSDKISGSNLEAIDPWIEVTPDGLVDVCRHLKTDPDLQFNLLNCITVVDYLHTDEKKAKKVDWDPHLEIVYHLSSTVRTHTLVVKVKSSRWQNDEVGVLPEIPSLCEVWKTADWHERETYDLSGINFVGHPDLRRILCPEDWVGHPLRKDYEMPLEYHGIRGR